MHKLINIVIKIFFLEKPKLSLNIIEYKPEVIKNTILLKLEAIIYLDASAGVK
jgi:hypothetical protein